MDRLKGILLTIALIVIAILSMFSARIFGRPQVMFGDKELESAIMVSSDDRCINITWDGLDRDEYDSIKAEIYSGDQLIYSKTVSPDRAYIRFRKGEHGRLYTVTVYGGDDSVSYDRLFLDYRELPKLPVVNITTVTGRDPDYTDALPYDYNMAGQSITDNDYLDASVCIYGVGQEEIVDRGCVKVRGNASNSSYNGKLSYRLKLDSKCGLTDESAQNGGYKHWVLLSTGCCLNTYIGDCMTRLVDMDYRNDMIYVNLMMNGDWKGCYCLTPAVTEKNARSKVGETGYLFENDVYYWNEDDLYFRTASTSEMMGYTFTYPEILDINDPRVTDLKDYLQSFEDYLYAGDEHYRDYIDEESFAKWLLVRDVTGEGDGYGANIYYYKYDFDPADPTSSKLKMGPVWDFDNIFDDMSIMSNCRLYGVTYFDELVRQPHFRELYRDLWDQIASDLYSYMDTALEDLDGSSLDKSWELETDRWGYEIAPFEEQKNTALDWFRDRPDRIESLLLAEDAEFGLLKEDDFEVISDSVEYVIDSVEEADEFSQINGWAILKGVASIAENVHIAIVDRDGNIHMTGTVERDDVQAAYGLDYNTPGFYVYVRDPVDCKVVILDMDNKILYK